jgi:hypothetical protein
MTAIEKFLDRVLVEALLEVRKKKVRVFTFAFYHDHESRAVSVCVDTEENSARAVVKSNAFSWKYFWPAVKARYLEDIELWNANTGRSLSLGDFTLVNLARRGLPRGKVTKDLYLGMMEAMHAREEEILKCAASRDALLFCCSGPNDEVEFCWTAQPATSK